MRLLSTIELIFGIAIGIVGVLGLTFGFRMRPVHIDVSENTASPAIEAMTLFQQIMSEPEPAPAGKPTKQLFLNRVLAGREWIQSDANTPDPIPLRPGSELSWRCRAGHNAFDKTDFRKDLLPVTAYRPGQYQIAIMVYRSADAAALPVASYTGVIWPEGPPEKK